MAGELKINLIALFKEATDVPELKERVEEFVRLNPDFKIEKIEWSEIARRPVEQMMIDVLREISKKLDEIKLAQQDLR